MQTELAVKYIINVLLPVLHMNVKHIMFSCETYFGLDVVTVESLILSH